MLTQERFELKKKDFKKWARNDAKHFVLNEKKTDKTIGEHLVSCIRVYEKERLMTQFNYSEQQYDAIINWYNTNFWRGYEYWNKQAQKHSLTMLKYKDLFDRATEFGNNIDVSDIVDGFPCGYGHLYLAEKHHNEDIGKAVAFYNNASDSSVYKYALKLYFTTIKGQSISYENRVLPMVQKFLLDNGLETYVHTWID